MSLTHLAVVMPLVGLLGTCLSIPLLRRLALLHGIVALPYGKPRDSKPVPALGGAAIYLPFAVVTLAYLLLRVNGNIVAPLPKLSQVASLFLGTTFMLILGTLDDKVPLSWTKKLLGQILSVLVLVLGGHSIGTATIPWLGPVDFGLWGHLLFALAVIAVTNAINLCDGIDGLAGGMCFFVALTCSIIALAKQDMCTAIMTLTLSGSLLGFLVFNFPPASIFMGDGGSLMLGFLLGTMATSSAAIAPGQRFGTSLMVLVPVLMFGIPLLDMGLAVVRRGIRGQSIFLGDRDHLHHRLIKWLRDARLVLAIFYIFSAGLSALTLLIVFQGNSWPLKLAAAAVALLLLLGLIGSIWLYRVDSWKKTIRNRPHFKFLGGFLKFMNLRLKLSRSLGELVPLMQCGVTDLGFDTVLVLSLGEPLAKFVNPASNHSENSRVVGAKDFPEAGLRVEWVRPKHDDPEYDEYVTLVWDRFVVAWEARVSMCSKGNDAPDQRTALDNSLNCSP